MAKKLFLPIIILTLLGAFASCNESVDNTYEYTESTSVIVTGFSLGSDAKVLDSLSNVFFTIDLMGGRIFNADSLPYGTNVKRLVPIITAASSASSLKLSYFCDKTGRDSVVDYIKSPTDSIDFTHPVQLTVVSESAAVTRTYQIKVNVHQQKADSLAWYMLESAPLPGSFTHLQAQRVERMGGRYYSLSTDGSAYCMATTADPADPQWQSSEVAFAFTPVVESMRATDNALYILADNGDMYTSADGADWQPTGESRHYLYGGYGDQILGCTLAADGNKICSYPSGRTWAMPAAFPVEGTTAPAAYTLQMAGSPQMVMLGGRLANGVLTSYAWGFDGSEWAEISVKPIPVALEYMTLVPYMLSETKSTNWKPEKLPVLLAFGGRTAQGAISRTVYYSRDWGMTWHTAPELVQLPESVPTAYGMQAYEYATTMYTRSRASQWAPEAVKPLPPQYTFELPAAQSRAVTAPTEWQCPAIYMYGGRDYSGQAIDQSWRAVILQFTYPPVY